MRRRNALFAGLLAAVLLCGIPARAAFADVPEGAWYAEAVNWCREDGIVNDGTAFQPETVMTRAMVATALYRAAGAPDVSANTREFTDVSANAAVAWAAETGVVNGYDDGTFKPDNPVTRQQFAAMLWRSAGSPAADAGTDYADKDTISAGVAENLAAALNADIYEITPEEPYTAEDLNYNDRTTRATVEQNTPDVRPAIAGGVDNMEQYDTVFIGYPIWWGDAPRIVSTFAESYSFDGKTAVAFCTSGGSGIATSERTLREQADGAQWLSGKRFSGGASVEELREWAAGLGV